MEFVRKKNYTCVHVRKHELQ